MLKSQVLNRHSSKCPQPSPIQESDLNLGIDVLTGLTAFKHSTQRQTLDYLCIQDKEIQNIFNLELSNLPNLCKLQIRSKYLLQEKIDPAIILNVTELSAKLRQKKWDY